MAEALSDQVKYWFTMNEPQCFLPDYLELAGRAGDQEVELTAYRHILLGHGRGVQELRKATKQTLKIGMVIMGLVVEPVPGAIDEDLAYTMMFSDQGGFMGMSRWMDPMLLGTVPESMSQVISSEDLEVIQQPMDLFTANVYGSANFYAT